MDLNIYNNNNAIKYMSDAQKLKAIEKTKEMTKEINKLNEDQAKSTLKTAAEMLNMGQAILETKDKQLVMVAEQAVLYKQKTSELEQENEFLSNTNEELKKELQNKARGDPVAEKKVNDLLKATHMMAETRVATKNADTKKSVKELLDESLKLATS